jgi:predicted HicB family RNase H-like nuclease
VWRDEMVERELTKRPLDVKQLKLRLPVDVHAKLKSEAANSGVSMNTLIIEYLVAGVSRPKN